LCFDNVLKAVLCCILHLTNANLTHIMQIPYCKLSLAFIIQLSALTLVNAQTKTATLLPPPKNIAIDGDVKEWGDSLRYYNTEKQINYAIANDKDNLYLAVRIEDRREQNKILKAGIVIVYSGFKAVSV